MVEREEGRVIVAKASSTLAIIPLNTERSGRGGRNDLRS
jgi:hypothetical protein